MKSFEINELAEQIVRSIVSEKVTFTIWDITNLIRSQVSDPNKIFHPVIKRMVEDGINYYGWATDYMCTSGDFFEKGIVRVFHHVAEDPNIYISQRRIVLGLDVPDVEDDIEDDTEDDTTNVPVVTVTSANDDDEIIIKTVDSQNRIRFTKHILESAGFIAGQKCNVTFSSDSIIVTCVANGASFTHTIDEYTNLRVSLNAMQYTANAYLISVPSQGVVVAVPTDILDKD